MMKLMVMMLMLIVVMLIEMMVIWTTVNEDKEFCRPIRWYGNIDEVNGAYADSSDGNVEHKRDSGCQWG